MVRNFPRFSGTFGLSATLGNFEKALGEGGDKFV
jgi:hypothetical protein